jgi:hypothetical protein
MPLTINRWKGCFLFLILFIIAREPEKTGSRPFWITVLQTSKTEKNVNNAWMTAVPATKELLSPNPDIS